MVTFMFSSGMPLLYLIMVINLTITYWVDKFLLLRFYQTPVNYDNTSIRVTVYVVKFAVLFHFIIGYPILSNDDIISSPKLIFEERILKFVDSYIPIIPT
jgi:hypothetical protein